MPRRDERYRAVEADRGLDSQLRTLIDATPVPGHICVSFRREPDFFHGLHIQGRRNQVLAVMDGEEMVGLACRSVKPMFVNGQAMDFGYFSGLRITPGHRGGPVSDVGHQLMHQFHDADPVPGYLATIIEGNAYAIKALVSKQRTHQPRYVAMGSYHTYAIQLKRRSSPREREDITVTRGTPTRQEEIVSFLNREGRRRQFFPAWTTDDFDTSYLRGFSPEDFYLAERDGRLVGVVGAWDQTAFKQQVVISYSGLIRLARPMINIGLRLAGYRPLPIPGGQFKVTYASFISASDDDPTVLQHLLQHVAADVAATGKHFLIAGFHERDPLRAAVTGFRTIRYDSRLFVPRWEDGEVFCEGLDGELVPYLEVATL